MRVFGKSITKIFSAARKAGSLLLDKGLEALNYAGLIKSQQQGGSPTVQDPKAQRYIDALANLTEKNIASDSGVSNNELAPSPSSVADTVVEDRQISGLTMKNETMADGFKSATSRKIEFKTQSYINEAGILTTDLIFPEEAGSSKRTPYNIVETYKRRGIQCNWVEGTASPAIVRFAGKEAIKLQKDKSMIGRLKLKAQSEESAHSINISRTLKAQSWKTGLSSKTGEFYAALPLGREASTGTQAILKSLRDIGIKPVKKKDSNGVEHMLIKGPNASKLLNAGLFGSGLGTESFKLTAPAHDNSYENAGAEQRVDYSDILDTMVSPPSNRRLPTIQPAFS